MEASRRVRVDGHLLGLAGAAAGFALFPAIVGRSNVVAIDVMILVFVYATVASAWNLIGGYVGQFALSNAVFDTSLREGNPEWGVRDVGDVEKLAQGAGLGLIDAIEMPANNLTLVFARS